MENPELQDIVESTRERLAALSTGQTLASFDFAFQPSVERSQVESLGICAWVRAKEALPIQGPPAVGKTQVPVDVWHGRRRRGLPGPGVRIGAGTLSVSGCTP